MLRLILVLKTTCHFVVDTDDDDDDDDDDKSKGEGAISFVLSFCVCVRIYLVRRDGRSGTGLSFRICMYIF